ncbi:flagellar basal body-associated protein FliL [Acerihabitans arboris]|uniref:Flagellar protein FliL n=1 Tax=Acerihabitans arboris TaxID=2691583 RepID=A0A845SHT7_9GAMM|nr:flagellar basal body-associated protein FliL [Acerihabitans arboris]NDL62606.1 flagellar basal body-associated protein FliL [Acerihabitans arboris]
MSQNVLPTARKQSKWLVALVIIALAAGGAAGYLWWQHKLPGQMAKQTAPAEAPIPIFMPLDTFTVNLANPANDPDRVLYIGLTLRLPDEATRKEMMDFLPTVRSRLLLLLTRQDAGALANDQGKLQLVEQIKLILNEPLVTGQPRPVVNDVLFTAFILR